jgi:hypothetical protein
VIPNHGSFSDLTVLPYSGAFTNHGL